MEYDDIKLDESHFDFTKKLSRKNMEKFNINYFGGLNIDYILKYKIDVGIYGPILEKNFKHYKIKTKELKNNDFMYNYLTKSYIFNLVEEYMILKIIKHKKIIEYFHDWFNQNSKIIPSDKKITYVIIEWFIKIHSINGIFNMDILALFNGRYDSITDT